MKLIIVVLLFFLNSVNSVPKPPTTWPPQFTAWLITSVVSVNQTQPIYVYGQNVVYDSKNNFTTRYNQQNLVTPSPVRADDYCDYIKGFHYRVNDTAGGQGQNPPCAASVKTGAFPVLTWSQDFVDKAQYLGQDHVNDEYCDHFYMRPIPIGNLPYQLDIWTSTGDQFPCQISVQNIGSPIYITTWSFTGFKPNIPIDIGVAAFAKIQCSQQNWICQAVSNASFTVLLNALNYACSYIDCAPIQPGGSYYYPNTIVDHCNWAFNQYYQTYKINQGYNACVFGGVAVLVPPSELLTNGVNNLSSPFPPPPLYALDLMCPSLW